MTAPSPAPSSSHNSEGRHDSEMTLEEECSGGRQEAGEDVAVCRSGTSSGTPVSTGTCAPECADMCSQSEMCTANLNPQQPEVTVSATAADTARGTDSWRVSIDTLPDELLVKIFSHLSFTELIGVQKVSTRWKRVSQDAELWANKQYEVRYDYESLSDTWGGGWTDQEAIQTFCDVPNLRSVFMQRSATSRVFRTLYNRCHRLSDLHLNHDQKFSYSVLKNLVEKCSRIHKLSISNQQLKDEKISEIISQLKELRVLEISQLKVLRVLEMEIKKSEESPVLRPLGDGCPRLAEVDFRQILIDMDELRYFLNAKRNTLKAVRIKWAMVGKRCVLPLLTVCADSLERLELTDFDIVPADEREAFTALGSLKNLQELTMRIDQSLQRGVAALAFKAGGLPKLRLLDLRGSISLDNDTMIAISRGCPAVRELYLAGAGKLSDAAFSQIYRLQYLETLDITGCRGFGGALIPCLAGLPHLRTLRMGSLELPKLQPGLSSIVELSGLRSLTLSCSLVIGVPFDKFPGKLVELRAGGLQNLRMLDIRYSIDLDNDTMIAISRGCPALRELILRNADNLSDAAFSQIYRLQYLETLDISSCIGLGGALIPCLARLPHLRTLSMEWLEFPKLQPGLSSIVELSGLRSLTLSHSLVTGVPFDRFPGKLVELRELNVEWCSGDPKATEGLTDRMPYLKIHGRLLKERDDDTEGHEGDAELREEENQENADGGDADSGSDSESDNESIIWGERGISDLFLENVDE